MLIFKMDNLVFWFSGFVFIDFILFIFLPLQTGASRGPFSRTMHCVKECVIAEKNGTEIHKKRMEVFLTHSSLRPASAGQIMDLC